jgi:hypothetical protein
MAGTGVRLFLSGDTAYAADINTYLMDQVVARFATTAARDAAFGDGIPVSQGGSGKPALSEGRICYIDELNLIQYYNGASWQDSAQFTVGDGAITTQKLAANSVTSDKIAPGTVIAADIAAGTITATELADGAVTSGKILDGTIVNADINTSAAIAYSKLNLATSIVNADINASAAIDKTKISGTAVTLADTGVITSAMIENDSIVNADIKSNAAIAYSKLSLSGSITTTDLATGAARSGFRSPIVAQQGATHTIAASDVGGLVVLSSCTSVVIPTSDATFTVGDRIDFLQTGTQVVTFSATSPQTVGGFDAQLKLGGQFAVATLVKYAANTWVLVGNITS